MTPGRSKRGEISDGRAEHRHPGGKTRLGALPDQAALEFRRRVFEIWFAALSSRM